MTGKISYIGPERRTGEDLSLKRAEEILGSLELAQDHLSKLRDSMGARVKRWLSDRLGLNHSDVDIDCEFRAQDSARVIRRLFDESSRLFEAKHCDELRVRPDERDVVADEYLAARSDVLCDLAEILVRAGIVKPKEVEEYSSSYKFQEGGVYLLNIEGKKNLAFCVGFSDGDSHFSGDSRLPKGLPIFQFNGINVNDLYHKIGKEYLVQETSTDAHYQFCGYTGYGWPVMKFLRRESILGRDFDESFKTGLNS